MWVSQVSFGAADGCKESLKGRRCRVTLWNMTLGWSLVVDFGGGTWVETVGVRKLMYEGNCSRFFSRFDPNRAQLNWFPLGETFQEQPARGLTAWVSSSCLVLVVLKRSSQLDFYAESWTTFHEDKKPGMKSSCITFGDYINSGTPGKG